MGDLTERYENVEAVLADVVVFRRSTGRIHRPVGDAEAWCGSTEEVEYVDASRALAVGAELCKSCYRPALAHLARMPSSPVVDTEADPSETQTPSDPNAHLPGDGRPALPLAAITYEVVVATGSTNTYHAPTAAGGPACDTDVDGATRRRLDQTPPSGRPCTRCFAESVVERFRGRDTDEHAVVETVEPRR